MKKLFILLLLCSPLFAQSKFVFDFDYAQFGFDSLSNYIEVYYSFNQNTLAHIEKDGQKVINAALTIVLQDTTKDTALVNRTFSITYPTASLDSTKSLIGVLNFKVPAGYYKLTVVGKDPNNLRSVKSITERLKVIPYLSDGTALSNIQLASQIIPESTNKESMFYKNSFEVIPMPTTVFGQNQPVVFYYMELYNLSDGKSASDSYKMVTSIYNSKGKAIHNKTKSIIRKVDSRVEVNTLPVNKYFTDTYTLVVSLIDSATNMGITSSKKFYVYNPELQQQLDSIAESGTASGSIFSGMSEEEIDDLAHKSRYIINKSETDGFNKIKTLEGKRDFLFKIWFKRDTDPSTQENEALTDYLRNIEIANQRYGSMQKVGWKSDRGRVFLTYGEPSEVERYPNQLDKKPYELWRYNDIEGGVYFVFADLTGFSEYQLIHSTKRSELRDDNWESRISTF